jgi:hypothetical protein
VKAGLDGGTPGRSEDPSIQRSAPVELGEEGERMKGCAVGVGEIFARGGRRTDRDLVRQGADGIEEQPLLVGIVQVEGGPVDPCRSGQLADGDFVEILASCQVDERSHQLRPGPDGPWVGGAHVGCGVALHGDVP